MSRSVNEDYLQKFRFKVRLGELEIGCSRVLFEVRDGVGYLSFEKALMVGRVEFLSIAQGVVPVPEVALVLPMDRKSEEVASRGVSIHRPKFHTYGIEFDAVSSEILLEKLVLKSTVWEIPLEESKG
jgi:hypothetical protein